MDGMPSSLLVREFHEAFGHTVASHPNVGTPDLRMLRFRLILEELKEFANAAGIYFEFSVGTPKWNEPNLLGMADALLDLDYVVSGSMVAFGFDQWSGIVEVHRSNMSKLGEDGKPLYREDGKILKGPNYEPPDLVSALRLHRQE